MAAADQLKLGDGMCRLGMSSEGKWGEKRRRWGGGKCCREGEDVVDRLS